MLYSKRWGVPIFLALLILLIISKSASAHPLGWNSVPSDGVLEVKMGKALDREHKQIRDKAIRIWNGWRGEKDLTRKQASLVRKAGNHRGKVDIVMRKDNSNPYMLMSFNANRYPYTIGVNTRNIKRVSRADAVATMTHEFGHANGGYHPSSLYCRYSVMVSFGSCGYLNWNIRRTTPGPHDTYDARHGARAGGWTKPADRSSTSTVRDSVVFLPQEIGYTYVPWYTGDVH